MNDVKGKMQALKTSQDKRRKEQDAFGAYTWPSGIIRMCGFFVSGTCDYHNVCNCKGLEWRHGAIVDVA